MLSCVFIVTVCYLSWCIATLRVVILATVFAAAMPLKTRWPANSQRYFLFLCERASVGSGLIGLLGL
jgi:hypothetical protein